MKCIIAENITSTTTITASTENPSYTFDVALKDSRLSRIGKTTSCNEQWIAFDFDNDIYFDTIAILKNNFTPNATVVLKGNIEDTWTDPMFEFELSYVKDNKRSLDLGRDVGIWYYPSNSATDTSITIDDGNDVPIVDDDDDPFIGAYGGLYWKLFIDDPDNPEELLSIGFIFIDNSTIFPGMSVNQVFARQSTSVPDFSTSGQVYGLKQLQYNEASFNFHTVTEEEKEEIDTFFDKTDLITPYMMLVWENSLDVQKPLYVISKTVPEWKRIETEDCVLWTFSHEIREVF